MNGKQTTYYLDTTIQLAKFFAPYSIRQNIELHMAQNHCVVSRYVRMEYLRWLEPCTQLHQLLQDEMARNRSTALSETQARILLTFGRDQNKMLSILTLLYRQSDQDAYDALLRLEHIIERRFLLFFGQGVTELPDPIGCPLMDLQAISHGTGYQLDPNIPYRRGEMPCNIVESLSEHRHELQELAGALNERYPRMAEACQRVLARPADAQGNNCKTLGDVIIALQTPDDAILWTTDASFEMICPVLGIEFLRESLQS